MSSIDSTAGTGYELQVISAVVVGGVAIFGGSGSAVGAALGALLLNTISSALYVLGISPFWDQAIFGFLLLLAITLDRFISLMLTAALRSISIGNLSERLPSRATGDEIERLAETCNEMLSRLEAAVAEIKRFTADASHELRSPLSYIHMVAEYALRNPGLRAECRESFEEIVAESRDATRLLEEMLLLARADAGHVDMAFETADLGELVKDVFERARIPAQAKGHQIRLRCADRVEVHGDPAGLHRLVWTLLDNAIKYTPQGGRIDVSLERDGTHGRLRVQDNGIGIPPDLLPRVFERFFRADPARAQGDGAGLGLAIAKWIADVHHGVLSVDSQPGRGTVFTAVFPLDFPDRR